ncbi:MAG: YkvA family protein [Planctomycetota bacterium]
MLEKLKKHARHLKQETFTLFLASRDPRTPWYAKLLAASIVAYAFSPIDLIPDFIPIIGYLDDLIVIPIGIALVIKLVPESILADCRLKAKDEIQNRKPVSWFAGGLIIALWLLIALFLVFWGSKFTIGRT